MLLTGLLLTSSAWAADLYVSPNGSDSNSGTQSAPFRTIQKAAGLVKAGSTVHVAAGNYSGNISSRNSGTATARIRFVSDTAWGAKIVGSGTESVWNQGGSYTDIVGFDISGPPRIGILNNASYNAILGNHIHDMKVSGGCTGSGGAGIVNANYTGRDNDIVGNVVHDIGTPGACNGVHAIYHANLGGHIYNNIAYRASAFGIHLWHAANQVVVMNNTVFSNGSASMGGGIVLGTGDAPGGVTLDNTIVANNIVYNNPGASIWEYCYSGQNCIGSNVKVTNNLLYGNGKSISLKVGSATNTINANPLFVNFAGGDYRLQSTSPAVDKGIATSAPAKDFAGVTRPQGAGIDIGAYELVANGNTQAPTPTIAVSSLQLKPGQSFSVQITGAGTSTSEYAALYAASVADSAWSFDGQFKYLNGTNTAPASPIRDATLTFVAPKVAGTYNIRLFGSSNAQNRLAVSPSFKVIVVTTRTR